MSASELKGGDALNGQVYFSDYLLKSSLEESLLKMLKRHLSYEIDEPKESSNSEVLVKPIRFPSETSIAIGRDFELRARTVLANNNINDIRVC